MATRLQRLTQRFPLWLLFVLAGILVLMPAASVNFNSDGVWYMDHALNVAQGRGLVDVDQQTALSVRLFFPLLMGAVYRLVGPSEVATYVVLRLFFIFNLVLVYAFAGRLFGRFAGFTAALLVFTSFALNEWQTVINLDYLLAFWLLLTIYLLYRAFQSMRLPVFLIAGLAIGVSISVKETAFVIAALPPLYWLLIPAYRSRRGLLGVVVAVAPLIVAGAAILLLLTSRGVELWRLMGSFVPLFNQNAGAAAAPSLANVAAPLLTYYQMHMAPYFFLAPLLIFAWVYVAVRSVVPRLSCLPYRFLTLSTLVFLPQTVVLGRIARGQRPGQNFIMFLLLYVALAVLLCDVGKGLRRLLAARLFQGEAERPDRMSGGLGVPRGRLLVGWAVAVLLVLVVASAQAVESKTTWTAAPELKFSKRGSMLDHWRRFNTIAYLRSSRNWTSQIDVLREAGAWLDTHLTEGDGVLASLDAMRWLYWTTGGRHPMTETRALAWWTGGSAQGGSPPDAPFDDVALFVLDDSQTGSWRVVRQSTFFQALRDRSIRTVVLDARDGFLLPFLMEHPAFVLTKETNVRWIFEVREDQLAPAPGVWRAVGATRQALQTMQTAPERYLPFERVVLKDTLGFTAADIGQIVDNPNRSAALDLRLGQYLRSLNTMSPDDLERLRRTFEAKAQARPDAAWSWVLLAQVMKRQGDDQASWKTIRKAAALGVSDPAAASLVLPEYLRRINGAMSAQNYKQSTGLIQEAASLGLDRHDTNEQLLPLLVKHTDALVEAGYGKDLVAAYEAVQKRTPESDDAYALIAGVYMRMGDLNKAAATYQQMIQRFPWHAPAYYGLGQVYLKMGRDADAAQAFEVAVVKRPDWEAPYASLMPLLVADGQTDKALALAQEAAKANPAQEWPQNLIKKYLLAPAAN